MFTAPCFIRQNTQEIRIRLSEMGYSESVFFCGDLSNLCVNVLCNGEYDEANDYAPLLCNAVDCFENEDLFLAIAALRDDSDFGQLFVMKDGRFEFGIIPKVPLGDEFGVDHKATAKEIIEHFKINKWKDG